MADPGVLELCVSPDSESDLDELADAVGRLRTELLELDVLGVDTKAAMPTPEHAKGLGAVAGALVVRLGSLSGLRAVLEVIRSWAGRTNRTVEVSLDGDTLKVVGATSAQQEKIIDAWIARHGTSA
jgi:hypothetical protein